MSDYNDEDRRDLSPDQARVYRNYLLTCRRLGVMPTSPERAKVLLEEWAAACRDATQLPARSMSESQSCGTRPPGKRNPPRRAALSHSGAQALRCWAAFIRVLDLRGPEFSPHRHEGQTRTRLLPPLLFAGGGLYSSPNRPEILSNVERTCSPD